MTRLIEFKNHKGETLRGLIDAADSLSGTKTGVILIHGFERTTVEPKFKNIIDELKGRVSTFRFDFSGHGLSDGKFEDISVEKMEKELKIAIETFKREIPHLKKINIVAHSLGACTILKLISKDPKTINKAVFMSPAFNQKDLLRYWFIKNKEGKRCDVNWSNYRKNFAEKEFQADLKIRKRMVKGHYLENGYYLENENIDYQDLFAEINFNLKKFLIIEGSLNDKLPPESNNKLPNGIEIIRIANGDHDLERPDMASQYLKKLVDFLQ